MADGMAPGLRGVRVLVVEDEYLLAAEMAEALYDLGADVLGPVPTLSQARSLLEHERYPDAAILDVNLGGEFIWPIVDLLRAANTPVVLATGYDDDVITAPYDQLPRCEKPVSPHAVLALLRRVLPQPGADPVHAPLPQP